MAGFENYLRSTRQIEREIARMGVALGVDWSNELQVRALAREALDGAAREVQAAVARPGDRRLMAKVALFGLAALMMHTMAESAQNLGIAGHGGPTWKAFGRALWVENEARKARAPQQRDEDDRPARD